MLTVLGCIVQQHDLVLVALAAGICALASLTTTAVLRHAARSAAGFGWIAVAAVAGGSGIWATHFIAMLAFAPGLPTAYDLGLTILSFGLAVLLCGLGITVALIPPRRVWSLVGGALLGGGIAAMHYTGMAAFAVPGHVHWDATLVSASLVLGGVFGAAALGVTLGVRGHVGQFCGAALMLVAICSHHFTAMGAVTIVPDPTVAIPGHSVPTSWLAVAVALASFAILLLAGAALAVDLRDRRHTAQEGERLRSLANAAVEGLVVLKDDRIVSANDSFAALVGVPAGELPGRAIASHLAPELLRRAGSTPSDQPIEAELHTADGGVIPVEMIVRPVEYAAKPHQAVALRDLRARRRAEKQIHFLAHHDPLTGLANRASFALRLENEMRAANAASRKLAVLCLDLDRFKEVNDLFGHAAGDLLLQRVATAVSRLLEADQMMARLGGDEFAILMPCEHAVAAGRLAEAVIAAVEGTSQDGHEGPPAATSIGIAIYPDDAREPTLLLSYADTALYRAKDEGRNTFRFYEQRMGNEVRERRLLEHDLRHAIARREFEIVYQPQTAVGSGDTIGFEALLRWRHPVHGDVAPSLFIPIAEESGTILPIGEWILREVCREAASWPKRLSIAVNVSAVQIHAANFVSLVHEVLLNTGLEASRLEIEITETALIRDPTRALHTLRQLKALGLRIAMDDFGTGYSSLSNLRSFPFDKIKIDRSFVRSVGTNEQTAAIVRSVLGLGRGLGLPVLAEGVETEEELRFLQAEECFAAQGYLIGRPGSIDTFAVETGKEVDRPLSVQAAA